MTATDYQNQIYNTVIGQGYTDTLAKLIVAQAQNESANFTSHVFVNTNNPFGMTYSGQKLAGVSDVNQPTSEAGLAYAAYPDVGVATLDLLAWLNRRQAQGDFTITCLQTPNEYAQALKCAGYYTAPESQYSKNIAYYFNQAKDYVITSASTNPVATYSVAGAVIVAGISLLWFGVYKIIQSRKGK